MNEIDASAAASGTPPAGAPGSTQPPPPRKPPRPRMFGCWFLFFLLLNVVALGVIAVGCLGYSGKRLLSAESGEEALTEKPFAGKSKGKDKDKIAIITLDGIIMEGRLDFVHRQIEQAEADSSVKAVVFHINSPGGSITASDDIYRRMKKLTDVGANGQPKRPLIISMGSMAASGGYYVAMPGQTIFCERTGVTGSIGVYSAFPNFADFMKEHKLDMIVIKQGAIKDSGSPFKEMPPAERAVWQDMVDHAYRQFVQVVEEGRPKLKGHMLEKFTIKPLGPDGVEEKDEKKWLTRYRADGGIFTSDKAITYGLIDKEGTLEDAVEAAAKAANLSDYRVIQYEKTKTLSDMLFGVKAPQTPALLDAGKLQKALVPRVWFLAPGCELAGMAAAIDGE